MFNWRAKTVNCAYVVPTEKRTRYCDLQLHGWNWRSLSGKGQVTKSKDCVIPLVRNLQAEENVGHQRLMRDGERLNGKVNHRTEL